MFFVTLMSLKAQTLTVTVSDSTLTDKPNFLWVKTYQNGLFVFKDSVLVTKNIKDNLSIHLGNYKGYCELFYKNKNKGGLGFLYNYEEKKITVELKTSSSKTNEIVLSNSLENVISEQLIDIKSKFDQTFAEVDFNRNTLSRFDPLYFNKMLDFERQREELYNVLNRICDTASKDNSIMYISTFASLIKTPTAISFPIFKQLYDGYDALLHYHYFDFIDFSNPDILNHPIFAAKINEYFNIYCDNLNTSLNEGIDILMKKSAANSLVNNFVFNHLLNFFLERKQDAEIAYLYEKYADGCVLELSPVQQKEFSGIINSQIGNKIPDIVSYDNKSEIRSLYNEAEKNKYTIIYIWMSSCHACQTRTPKLMEQIMPYQKKGVGVFSISLDDNKEDWLLSIQKYKLDKWINIAELKALQQSTILPKLNIRTTPKLFIIDKNGIIVAKDIFGTDLQQKLEELTR